MIRNTSKLAFNLAAKSKLSNTSQSSPFIDDLLSSPTPTTSAATPATPPATATATEGEITSLLKKLLLSYGSNNRRAHILSDLLREQPQFDQFVQPLIQHGPTAGTTADKRQGVEKGKGKRRADSQEDERRREEDEQDSVGDKESLAACLMESYIRLQRPASALKIYYSHVFSAPAYTRTLPSASLVALRIKAHGAQDDLDKAETAFVQWRYHWFKCYRPASNSASSSSSVRSSSNSPPSSTTSTPIPPSAPYLALLNLYSTLAPPPYLPESEDQAYKFIPLLASDAIPMSTSIIRGLLAIELSRRHYGSFWALSRHFLRLGWRMESDWVRLCLKARRWENLERKRRKGKRDKMSAFQVMWDEEKDHDDAGIALKTTPTNRQILHHYLLGLLEVTKSRPSIEVALPNYDRTSVYTTFNLLLQTFIESKDWHAAGVVLESFRVYRIEPSDRTHGIAVLGIVKLWENGRLSEGEDFRNTIFVSSFGSSPATPPASTNQSRMGKSIVGRAKESLEIIKIILDTRKIKVRLWDASSSTPMKEEPPEWLKTRELRDLSYLAELLRICAGQSEERWNNVMKHVRKEILPPKKTEGTSSSSSEGYFGHTFSPRDYLRLPYSPKVVEQPDLSTSASRWREVAFEAKLEEARKRRWDSPVGKERRCRSARNGI